MDRPELLMFQRAVEVIRPSFYKFDADEILFCPVVEDDVPCDFRTEWVKEGGGAALPALELVAHVMVDHGRWLRRETEGSLPAGHVAHIPIRPFDPDGDQWHVEHHGQAVHGFWPEFVKLPNEGPVCDGRVSPFWGRFHSSEAAGMARQLEKVQAWLKARAAEDVAAEEVR